MRDASPVEQIFCPARGSHTQSETDFPHRKGRGKVRHDRLMARTFLVLGFLRRASVVRVGGQMAGRFLLLAFFGGVLVSHPRGGRVGGWTTDDDGYDDGHDGGNIVDGSTLPMAPMGSRGEVGVLVSCRSVSGDLNPPSSNTPSLPPKARGRKQATPTPPTQEASEEATQETAKASAAQPRPPRHQNPIRAPISVSKNVSVHPTRHINDPPIGRPASWAGLARQVGRTHLPILKHIDPSI